MASASVLLGLRRQQMTRQTGSLSSGCWHWKRSFLWWTPLVDQMPLGSPWPLLCSQPSASACFASNAPATLCRSLPVGHLSWRAYVCREPAVSPEAALSQRLMRVGEWKSHPLAWSWDNTWDVISAPEPVELLCPAFLLPYQFLLGTLPYITSTQTFISRLASGGPHLWHLPETLPFSVGPNFSFVPGSFPPSMWVSMNTG